MSTTHRVLALASSLLSLAGCPNNGDTDPVTTTDTTGAQSTTSTGASTGASDPSGGVTTSGTADTDTATTSSGTTTTGVTATTGAGATDGGSSTAGACGAVDCGACPEGCTAKNECVDGQWTCECIDCPPEIACDEDPEKFPEFDESCGVAEDCAIVFHQLDCCGSQAAWGVNADVAKAFGEAEATCEMQYPLCECPTLPPVADDGKSAEDPALIQVACDDGQCQTYVP